MLVSQLNFRKKSALRETRVRPSLESDLRHSALVAYVGKFRIPGSPRQHSDSNVLSHPSYGSGGGVETFPPSARNGSAYPGRIAWIELGWDLEVQLEVTEWNAGVR